MTPQELRAARLQLGLTQAGLADALGYAGGKTVIYLKEARRRPITKRDALAILTLLRRRRVAGK